MTNNVCSYIGFNYAMCVFFYQAEAYYVLISARVWIDHVHRLKWQKRWSRAFVTLFLGGFGCGEAFAKSCHAMPKWLCGCAVHHQLLRQGEQCSSWRRLHSCLWRWQLPSAVHRKRPDTWLGWRGDQWVWLASSRAVCATESTELEESHLDEMGDLRLWWCLLISDFSGNAWFTIRFLHRSSWIYARTLAQSNG